MAEATVLPLSRKQVGNKNVRGDSRDIGRDDVVLKMGQLYRLDDGTIVVAARGKHVVRDMIHDKWRSWALPDFAPTSVAIMVTMRYMDDWFDEDGDLLDQVPDETWLFAPPADSDPFDPKTFVPHEWGGQVEATTEDDPRVIRVLADGLVIVALRDVPEGVSRSVAWASVGTAAADSTALSYVGPQSATAPSTYFVRMRLSDLPASTRPKAQVEIPIEPQYKHGNSGRTYTFDTGINEFTRELGWRPLDLAGGSGKGPAFDPVAPVMAIHDLMEHFPGDEYAPHNEYMAQGAMLWLRSEGGFFDGGNVADLVVKPAFGMLFHHIRNGRLDTLQLTDATMAAEADLLRLKEVDPMSQTSYFTMNEIVYKARKYIDELASVEADRDRLRTSLARGVPWIMLGYQRAVARYRGLYRSRLVSLYKAAVAQISRVTSGAKLKVTLDYERYSASIELTSRVTG